ncbi:MAG: polyprenol phosphomannose-dependent alpha 1,6 mannosyltransferase MptB [Frankia sp.]
MAGHARRFLARASAVHPHPVTVAVAGAGAAVAAVAAEARLGPRDPGVRDPSSWLGILPSLSVSESTRGLLAALAFVSLVTLCACWWLLYRAAAGGRLTARVAGWTWLAWSLPFALGPPLYSRDVYAYAAQGQLARHGLDPATTGISVLDRFGPGLERYVVAVDPRWHETHAPYGSTAVGIERAAVAIGGSPIGAVVVLRVVAILSVVAMVALVVQLLTDRSDLHGADGGGADACDAAVGSGAVGSGAVGSGSARSGAAVAIVLAALNPVTVIHLVGGAHLDALAGALLIAALVADRSDRRGHGLVAVALACAAGTIKVTAFLGLASLIVSHARRRRLTAAEAGRPGIPGIAGAIGADLLVAAAVAAASMVAVGFGPTWLRALATSGALRTEVAPASVAARVLSGAAMIVGVGGHDHLVLAGCRIAALLLVAAFVGWMLLRVAIGRAPLPGGRPGSAGSASIPLPVPAARTGTSAVTNAVTSTPGELGPSRRRDAEPGPRGRTRSDALVVVGYGSLAVALGSPVAYPWYLALAIPPLAALIGLGDRRTTAVRRILMIASIWLCMSAIAPLAPTWALLGRHPRSLVAALVAALVLIVAAVAARGPVARSRRSGRGAPADEPPATRIRTP